MSHTQLMPAQSVELSTASSPPRVKKTNMASGGRAWREDEEAYLLRTRLQKMPYKHIAAHLNKTELACRLHYHQLSHGSSRRKRATSGSPGSDQSPILATSAPSPARSLSPPRRYENYVVTPPSSHDLQLPSIMGHSPRMPPILPKPNAMSLGSRSMSPQDYRPSTPEGRHRTPLPAFNFNSGRTTGLTLNSSPRPESSYPSSATHTAAHVDLTRLQAVYEAHRDKFWDLVAHEYGYHATAHGLEKAWKTGRCCSPVLPPLASPKEDDRFAKTRISSILSTSEDPYRTHRL